MFLINHKLCSSCKLSIFVGFSFEIPIIQFNYMKTAYNCCWLAKQENQATNRLRFVMRGDSVSFHNHAN